MTELQEHLQNLTGNELSQALLAKAIDISPQSLSARMKNPKSEVTVSELKAAEEYFLKDIDNIKSDLTNSDIIPIPVLGDVEASMGYGVTVYDENQTATYNISRKLAHDLGISETKTRMIFARGNSMQPTIQGGDNLLVDMSKIDIYDGRIYCIRKDGQLYAKRLQKISATQLKIISDNKDYEPIIIDFKISPDIDFAVIGEVRWAGRVFV